MDSPPVLVAGAGPTGLTLAHELARRGVPFRLVERLPSPSPLSRALGIHARTLEVFDLMGGGIAEAVRERGVAVRGARLHFRNGREAGIDLLGLPSRHQGVLFLPQADTEQVLAEALARRGGTVERGVTLEGLAEDGAGDDVVARLRHPDGTIEEGRFRFVAGCDGAHSAVRKALGFGFDGAAYPEQFLLADLAVEGPLDPAHLHVFPSSEGLLAFFPLPGGLWRVIASLRGAAAAGPAPEPGAQPSLAEIQALAAARCPLGLRFSDPRWRAWFRVHHRLVSRLRSPGGRVFLAGDAAHIHSPAGGQGMNTGIQDAFNLGWKLARAVRGGPASLLDSYEAERLPVDRRVVRQTDAMTRIASLRAAPLRFLRDRLLPLLTRLSFVRRRAGLTLSQLAIHYRESPLSDDRPGAGPRAGDRAPDAAVLAAHFLDGAPLGLVAPCPDEAAADAVEEILRGRGLALLRCLDADAAYGKSPAFYLVRPDGYIGFRAPLAEAARLLPAYLKKL